MANNLKIEGGYFVITDTITPFKEFIREVRDEVKFNRDTNDVYRFIFNTNTTAGTSLNYTLGGELTEYTFANFIDDRTGLAFTDVDELDDFLSLNIGFFADASVISGYNLLQEEGTPLTKRQIIDFIGDNVTLTDDSGNLKTLVTIDSDKLPSNYQTIDAETDWDDNGSGLNKLENKVYLIANTVVLTAGFDTTAVDGVCFLIFRGIIAFISTDPLYSGTHTGAIETNDLGIIDINGTETIHEATGGGSSAVGNLMIHRNSTFIGFAARGFIKEMGGGVIMGTVQFSDCGLGLQLKNNAFNNLNLLVDNSGGTTNTPQISFAGTHGDIDLMGTRLEMNAGESYIQIAPNTIFSRMDPAGIPYTKADGGEFLASAKSSTTLAITDNGSSKVRLTWSGHTLTTEQVLTFSNAVSFAYDGDHDILEVVSVNVVDLDTAYLGDDTVDATTGDTNSFLDDNNFEAFNNGDQKNSNEIGVIAINTTITTTIAIAATPVKLTGSGSDWDETRARRAEYDDTKPGVVIYKSTKDQECALGANISVAVVSGGAKLMKAYIAVNDVIIPGSVAQMESNRIVTLQPRAIAELTEDDEVSVFLENFDDATNLQSEVGGISIISKK